MKKLSTVFCGKFVTSRDFSATISLKVVRLLRIRSKMLAYNRSVCRNWSVSVRQTSILPKSSSPSLVNGHCTVSGVLVSSTSPMGGS